MNLTNNARFNKVRQRALLSFNQLQRSIAIVLLISLPTGILEYLLPLFVAALGGSPTLIGLLVGLGAATRIVVLLSVGRLLDRGWIRWVLLTGLLLLTGGWSLWATFGSTTGLVVGRVLLSAGFVSVDLGVTWLVAAYAPADQRGRVFGRLTAASSQGAILGVFIAGILLVLRDPLTQRDALAVLQSVHINMRLPAPITRLLAFQTVFVIFAGCALMAIIFIHRHRTVATHRSASLEQWRALWRTQAVRRIVVINLLISVGYGTAVPMLLPLLQDRFQTELIGLGIAYAIPGVLYAIAPVLLGRLGDTWGYQRVIGLGLIINAGVYSTLPFAPNMVWAAIIWTGEAFAYSLYVPALNAWIASILPDQRGTILSISGLVAACGVTVSAPLGGWIYQHLAQPLPFLLAASVFVFAGWFALTRQQPSTVVASSNRGEPHD